MDFITNPPNQFYQNQGYSFDREERKTLIIDSPHANNHDPHVVDLFEPLIIDKLSDVYLESFTTHDANFNTTGVVAGVSSAFVVDIKEFNINSNSNNSHLYNKIVIPNEEDAPSSDAVTVHKSKKLNYICSINPTKLSRLNITITGLDSSTEMFQSTGRYILELVFISRK
jgi:hypothetical protein